MPAAQGFTAVPTQAAGRAQAGALGSARLVGLSGPDGVSPAAVALAPKKPSAFLQLFRKIVGGRKAATPEAGSAEAAAREPARKKAQAETAEFRAEASEARTASARRSRKGQALAGGNLPEAATAGTPAAPAPARRAGGSPEAVSPAVEAGRERRPAPARVFVIDLRSRPPKAENPAETRRAADATEPRSFERLLPARAAGTAEQTAPGSPSPATAPTPLPGRSPAEPASAPSSLPAALRERLLPEIVERAGIVLREGGEGEIRLVLKPEHLGAVRIRLHLGESSLEGRIVVDNSNVKELLDANLEQLKSALRQEGYTSANIDVTVSGGRGQEREPDSGQTLPAVAGRPVEEFERVTPALWDPGFTTVNLLA